MKRKERPPLPSADALQNDKVRVNTVCIHISIAQIGGDKNQFGFPATDTRKLAPIYLAVAKGTAKGKVICVQDIEKTLQSLAWRERDRRDNNERTE